VFDFGELTYPMANGKDRSEYSEFGFDELTYSMPNDK
jgi:hypothetical protein